LADRIDGSDRSRLARALLVAACLGSAGLWVTWGCSAGPVADGATLVNTRCSTCHSAQRGQTTSKTRQQWEQTVTRMVGKGAKVNEREQVVLVDYLAAITAR
jgi:hypothetical protein